MSQSVPFWVLFKHWSVVAFRLLTLCAWLWCFVQQVQFLYCRCQVLSEITTPIASWPREVFGEDSLSYISQVHHCSPEFLSPFHLVFIKIDGTTSSQIYNNFLFLPTSGLEIKMHYMLIIFTCITYGVFYSLCLHTFESSSFLFLFLLLVSSVQNKIVIRHLHVSQSDNPKKPTTHSWHSTLFCITIFPVNKT